jgi:hypothetical protein
VSSRSGKFDCQSRFLVRDRKLIVLKNEEKVFAAISIIAGLVTLTVTVWAFAKYPFEQVEGERFVRDEIQVLPVLGGIYFKPITIMMVSTFVCWLCALEALRGKLTRLPGTLRDLMFVCFCAVALVFGYEVTWNFLMWTSAHIINPNLPLDSLTQQLNPTILEPKNFVYITKRDTLVLGIGLYSMFFFRRDTREVIG